MLPVTASDHSLKRTHRICSEARTNFPYPSKSVPRRAVEVVPDNHRTLSSGARIGIALDTKESQGRGTKQSLCELCMDLNLLSEIVRLRALKSLRHHGAAQYSMAAWQGCQGCAGITKFLSELPSDWYSSLDPPVGTRTYFDMRSLLAQFFYGGNCDLDISHVNTVDISCHPGK
jgi:hypothetical protein